MPESKQHQVSIVNREQVALTGVRQVVNFDEREIVLETVLGVIVLKGRNLHILHLDLNTGELQATGEVALLSYTEVNGAARGRGLWQKVWK